MPRRKIGAVGRHPLTQALISSARGIARALMPSENAIDASILTNAALLNSIVTARLTNGVPAQMSHKAIRSAIEALAALGAARSYTVECHGELANLRDDHGLTERQVGCDYGKTMGDTSAPLRSVA